MAALGDLIEPRQRGPDISDKGQFGVGIADSQDPAHRPAADNHPVHIASGALHAEVVQGREALASEEVDTGEIKDELLGDAGVALDEAPERVAVRGVDVTPDVDEHARRSQVLSQQDGSATPLYLISGWEIHVMKRSGGSNRHGEPPSPARNDARANLERPCSLKAG